MKLDNEAFGVIQLVSKDLANHAAVLEENKRLREALLECEGEIERLLAHPAKHNAVIERTCYLRPALQHARAALKGQP